MKKTNSCLQTPEAGAIIHLVARTAVKNHWKSGRHGQKRLTQDEKSGWQRTNDVITYGSSHVKRKFREGQDLPASLPATQEREKHHNKQIYDNLTEMQPWRFLWMKKCYQTAHLRKRTSEKKFERTKPSKFRSREKSEEGKGLKFLTGAAFYCAELNLI